MVQEAVFYQTQSNNIPYKILFATVAYCIFSSVCDTSLQDQRIVKINKFLPQLS
jgi:hypothetical protein